jgi:hypothetical protein
MACSSLDWYVARQASKLRHELLSPKITRPQNYFRKVHNRKRPPPRNHKTSTPHSTTMPKSKRAKIVHLTKVDKKGKELTLKLFANVQECVDQYQYIFVFSVDNMRNTYLKQVRAELSDSRSVIFSNSGLPIDISNFRVASFSERQK